MSQCKFMEMQVQVKFHRTIVVIVIFGEMDGGGGGLKYVNKFPVDMKLASNIFVD